MLRRVLPLLALLVGWWTPNVTSADDQQATIALVARQTAQIRGLPLLRPVSARVLGPVQFATALKEAIARSTPDAELLLEQKELAELGLLRPSDDLKRLVYREAQVTVPCFYDPFSRTVVVRRDSTTVFGVARYLIAYATALALLDQHYHLLRLETASGTTAYRNTDVAAARQALLEGDAQLTQDRFVSREYSADELRALQVYATHQPPSVLPPSLLRLFGFSFDRYGGAGFVRVHYDAGGIGAVNALYSRLPRSTYEIMHPGRYDAGWKPARVPLHTVQGLSGWQQADDDVLGARGYDALLATYVGSHPADRAVSAYRGDRFVLLQQGTVSAMRLESVWETRAAQVSAQRIFLRALRARFPHASFGSSGGLTVSAPSYGVVIRGSGRHLLMSYAPTLDLAKTLAAAPVS